MKSLVLILGLLAMGLTVSATAIDYIVSMPPSFYKDLQEKGKIEIKKCAKVPRHIMVIDDYHVRLEKPHHGRRFGDEKFAF